MSAAPKKKQCEGEFVLRKQDDRETPFQAPLQDCKPRTVKVERAWRERIIKGKGWLFYVSKEKCLTVQVVNHPVCVDVVIISESETGLRLPSGRKQIR